MEKKLSVKDLKISFRTSNGKVQAVRNIDFDLYKGETLAIVGESGSGKSVTVRAVLGILANNAIVESGQIIYDGKDLLKITEDDFHSIRGDKIAMIFQDPLSSLNPIVRIGRQLTEAMILKNKVNRRNSRKEYRSKAKLLDEHTKAMLPEKSEESTELLSKFHKAEMKKASMEISYNLATYYADDVLQHVDHLLLAIPKNAAKNALEEIKYICRRMPFTNDDFVLKYDDDMKEKLESLLTLCKLCDSGKVKQTEKKEDEKEKSAKQEEASKQEKTAKQGKPAKKSAIKDYKPLLPYLEELKADLSNALGKEKPDFSAIAYHLVYINPTIPYIEDYKQLNKTMRAEYNDQFATAFYDFFAAGIEHAYSESLKLKKEAISGLKELYPELEKAETKKQFYSTAKKMIALVENSINRLLIVKDSMAYTFRSTLLGSIKNYYEKLKKNKKEAIRFDKQTKAVEKIRSRGKEPEYEVVAADIVGEDELRKIILDVVNGMIAHYEEIVAMDSQHDSRAYIEDFAEMLREQVSGMIYRVNKSIAKNKAIKLMEEVGIPEPAKRYKQYPFQFSGGMRQRIVIAIALSANPDILVCDEPTTALDVTIQSQILELINKLKQERNLSVIFITHDLGVVANMADRIAVMYAGKIVELGTSEDVFYDPRHPYTWALLASMPDLDTNEKLDAIPGTPPNMIYPPKGDAFAERNKYALQIDFEEQPPLFRISDTHSAATWLLHPDAPKVEPPKIVVDRIQRSLSKEN